MALKYNENSVKAVKFNGKEVQKVQVRASASDNYSTIYEITTKTTAFLFSGTTLNLSVIGPDGSTFYTTNTISKIITDTEGEILEVLGTEVDTLSTSKIYQGPTINGNNVSVILKNSKASTKTNASIKVTYRLLKTSF